MRRHLADGFIVLIVVILIFPILAPDHTLAGIGSLTFPNLLPAANKRGNTNVYQLALNNAAAAAGTAFCDDGSGNVTTSGCTAGGTAGANLFSSTSTATVTAAADTTLIGTVSGSTTVPANTWTAGSFMEISAQGYYSTPAAARTLNIKLNIGGSTRITTAAFTVIPSVTLGVWKFHCGVTTRTTGAGGTQIANCQFVASGTTLTAGDVAPLQTSATWTIDTTVGEAIDLTAAWDSTTGTPTISCSNIAAWIPGAPVTSVNGLTGAVTVSGSSITQGTFASLPAVCTTNDLYLQTDGPYLFRCSAVNTFSAFVGSFGLVTVPPSAGWSYDNQASSVTDNTNGLRYMTTPKSGTVSITGQVRTAPATPYTVSALLRHDFSGAQPGVGGTASNCGIALGFRDGTGKISLLRLFRDGSGNGIVTDKWTNSTTFSAAYQLYQAAVAATEVDLIYRQPAWLRLGDDGVNLTYSWSIDGQHWKQFFSVSRTDFFGAGPTQVGFFAYANGCAIEIGVLSWG